MGGPVDTFVVRLVLAMTVLAWGSVLLHDLVTPDAAAESIAPAAIASYDEGERSAPVDPRAPSLVPPTNTTPPSPEAALAALPQATHE